MQTNGLTKRQREIYEFLKDKIVNRGYGPTVREIGAHFDIRSPNGVMCHLKALEKKKLIVREKQMSRAIQLVQKPQQENAAELVAAVRGLEDPDEPGRFCGHAAEPCPQCEAVRNALERFGGAA